MSNGTPSVSVLEQRLADHMEYCESRFSKGENQFAELVEAIRQNNELIANAAANTDRVIAETEQVVKIYKDMQGAISIAVTLQKIGIWVIKWPLVGTGIYAIYKWTNGGGS